MVRPPRSPEDRLRESIHQLRKDGWTRGQIAQYVLTVLDLELPAGADLVRWLSTPDKDRKT